MKGGINVIMSREQEFISYRSNLSDNFEGNNVPGTESEVLGRETDFLPWMQSDKWQTSLVSLDLL